MRRTTALIVLLLGLTATGCATTIDESLATVPGTDPAEVNTTTTTLPAGSATVLLPVLLTEAADLSRRVRESDGDREALERINALWDATSLEVGRSNPELLGSFEGQLDMLRRAVQFNRPADADKAYRNLDALVDAVLA
jgi:copper chaperone CopZ